MADTIWNGQGTLVTPTSGAGTRKAISAVDNTTPIKVHATAHGFLTGDTIEQEGTSGIADGQFQITKVDANSYILNGTTAAGAATTGFAIDYELQPAFRMPANGTLADVNDVIALGEGLSNPVPFLYRRAGKLRLYNQYYIQNDWFTTPFNSNPWFTVNNFTSTSAIILAGTTATMQASSDTTSIPPYFVDGDLLELSVSGTIATVTHTGPQNAFIQLGLGITVNGVLQSVVGLPSVMLSAYYAVQGGSDPGGPLPQPFSLSGWYGPLGSALGNAVGYCLFARIDYISSSNQIDIQGWGEFSGTIKQWRAN
jgi:hypothetical protein